MKSLCEMLKDLVFLQTSIHWLDISLAEYRNVSNIKILPHLISFSSVFMINHLTMMLYQTTMLYQKRCFTKTMLYQILFYPMTMIHPPTIIYLKIMIYQLLHWMK